MIDLVRSAPHVELHRDKTFVVKVGGSCLTRKSLRAALARSLGTIHALGSRLVVVHGGGPQTDELARKLGEEPQFVAGRRVTTTTALRALRMACAGELHGELLAALDEASAPAVGVAGASAGLLRAKRRPPVEIDGERVDFGEVGDFVGCDPSPLVALMDSGRIPVMSPPFGDGSGALLNVNADTAAAELAVQLGAAKLLLVTDAPGIMTDIEDATSLLSTCSLSELESMEQAGSIAGGMRVKADAAKRALKGGVERVHMVSGVDPQALLVELYTNQGAGTLVTVQETAVEVAHS